MNHSVLLAQVVVEMPPAPPWLIGFTIFALSAAVIWMSLLVRHAANEERQYKEQLKKQHDDAANGTPTVR